MIKKAVTTPNAPMPSGTYSQAIQVGNTFYVAGQIPLEPHTLVLVNDSIEAEIHQVFKNLQAIALACGGTLDHFVKLSVYLTDLNHFPMVNTIMGEYFAAPYPARVTIQAAALPKGASIEIEGVMVV